ncbi:MAG: amino acid ABC transporter ATP-binding protein [Rhizobiales bacterium]|nr:amino acid ABC transporter ATP-binding protein [Hyphomicrobiales bacterium]OJX98778.1 MAG: ATP-binding protein [Rhizobiales bacterium 63-22]
MQAASAVDIRKVNKFYGPFQALKDISLSIPPGKVTCLIGPSGSGKSTLLRCINFLEEYDSGEILVDGKLMGYVSPGGRRLPGKRLREMRRSIGMVFQQFNLWPHMTALQNVAEGLIRVRGLSKGEAGAIAAEALRKVGLSDKVASYPSRLSGGQQQRVAIARAIAMEPRLMLFDEPTSALDPELVGEVLNVMKALANEGMTMAVVTHEMGFAAHVADQVAFMEKGELIATDAPAKLLHQPEDPRIQAFLRTYHERNSF